MSKRSYILPCLLAAAIAALLVLEHFNAKDGTIAYHELVVVDPEEFLPLAEFRLRPNPDATRIESFARAFAAAEGLSVEEQADHRQSHSPVSLMIAVNDYTKLCIVKTGVEMLGFFSMTLQQKHIGDAPAQLALFERLKEKVRAEFPELTIGNYSLGPRYASPQTR